MKKLQQNFYTKTPLQADTDISLYIPNGSFIQISTWSSANGTNLNFDMYFLDINGNLTKNQFSEVTDSTGAEQIQVAPLAEGFLVGINCSTTTAGITSGQVFVSVRILPNNSAVNFSYRTILQGYIQTGSNLFYSTGNFPSALDGKGFVTRLVPAVPGAGQEWTIPIPANFAFNLLGYTAVYTSDLNIGNRFPGLLWNVAAGSSVISSFGLPIGASAVRTLNMAQGITVFDDLVLIYAPLPEAVFLKPGDTVSSNTTNIQVGDQYTAIALIVEQFIFVGV